jgi:tetratricopeptide (TPR) repeat protein
MFPSIVCADDDLPPGLATDTKSLMNEAQDDMSAKKYVEAEIKFQRILDIEPDNVEIFQSLGNAQWAEDKKADAVRNYKRYLKARPDNVALKNWMIHMGYIDSESGETDLANSVGKKGQQNVGENASSSSESKTALELWQKAHAVISILGAYGFLSGSESDSEAIFSNYYGPGSNTYSEYEAGLQGSWEWKWIGAGLGFNYEWHQEHYDYTYNFYGGSNYTYVGDSNYGVYSFPAFVEFFYPFRYIKPGIQFGPDVFYVSGSDNYQDSWGLGLQVTPIVKFIPTDHWELFIDGRYSQPLNYFNQEYYVTPNTSELGRWTLGAGISYRL